MQTATKGVFYFTIMELTLKESILLELSKAKCGITTRCVCDNLGNIYGIGLVYARLYSLMRQYKVKRSNGLWYLNTHEPESSLIERKKA